MASRMRVPPFSVFAREPRGRTLVDRVDYRRALEAASLRRHAVELFLRDQSQNGLFTRPSGGGDVLERSDLAQAVEGAGAAALAARLRWTLQSDPLLLLDQVCELIEHFARPSPTHSLSVSLRPLRAEARTPDAYPWRVVIESSDPNLPAHLHESPVRPSIAVDFVYAKAPLRPFNRCQAGNGGLAGVAGGILMQPSTGRHWSTTCRHVTGDGCMSMAYPPGDWSDASTPDAVLLHSDSSCFTRPSAPVDVAPASEADTARLQTSAAPVRKFHPDRPTKLGWVRYPVGAVHYMGRLIRFPHFSVRPRQWQVGPLRFPPGVFSRPGDSGSWVLEEGSRLWLGMVVAGYDDGQDVMVADGRALLDYFSCVVSDSLDPEPLDRLRALTWR